MDSKRKGKRGKQQKIKKNRIKRWEREVQKSIQLYQKWDPSPEISSMSTNSGPNTCDTTSYKRDNGIDVDRDDIHDSTYQLAVEFKFNNIPRPIDDYSRLNDIECNLLRELFSVTKLKNISVSGNIVTSMKTTLE